MIDKFNKYFEAKEILKQNTDPNEYKNNMDTLKKILPKQEIEDNALRLQELLGCEVTMDYTAASFRKISVSDKREILSRYKSPVIKVYISSNNDERSGEIFEEIYHIKNRMEGIYPVKCRIVFEKWLERRSRYDPKRGHEKYKLAYVLTIKLK
jgi:hypothetical protein